MKQIQKMRRSSASSWSLETMEWRAPPAGAVRAVADGHQSFVEIHTIRRRWIPTTLKCQTWSWQPAMRLYASQAAG